MTTKTSKPTTAKTIPTTDVKTSIFQSTDTRDNHALPRFEYRPDNEAIPRVLSVTKIRKLSDLNLSQPWSGLILWTPALAAEGQLLNTKNRPVNQGSINHLKFDMLSGRWTAGGTDAIGFDIQGVLNNGQTRLQAIIESGVSIVLLVATGEPLEALQTKDRGARRTLAQNLKIHGVRHYKQAASFSQYTRLLASGNSNNFRLEMKDILLFLEENKEAFACLEEGFSSSLIRNGRIGGPMLFAYKKDPAAVARFVQSVAKGSNLPEGSPILAYRELVKHDDAKRLTQYEIGQYALCALRMHILGQTVKLRKDGSTPKLPKPKDTASDLAFFLDAYSEDSTVRRWMRGTR